MHGGRRPAVLKVKGDDVKLAFALIAVALVSQAQPRPEDLRNLQTLADQVKTALERGDLDAAFPVASNLLAGIVRQRQAIAPTQQEKLAKLEETTAVGKERFYALSDLAKTAFDAGDLDKAERYARELLSSASGNEKDWNYGNAVFIGNMVIGRVALRRDHNVQLAKASLRASAETPGSPQLNSFGPNMSLAKDLLVQGERDTVLEFFARCRAFWKSGGGRLDDWTAMVKGGGIPEFGANLFY
jgi:hypothetical protein